MGRVDEKLKVRAREGKESNWSTEAILGRKQESSLVMKSVKEIGNQCVQKIQNVFFRSFEFFEHAPEK